MLFLVSEKSLVPDVNSIEQLLSAVSPGQLVHIISSEQSKDLLELEGWQLSSGNISTF